jgi:hypothetical protein
MSSILSYPQYVRLEGNLGSRGADTAGVGTSVIEALRAKKHALRREGRRI